MSKLLFLIATLATTLILSEAATCKRLRNNRPTSYYLGRGNKKSIVFPLSRVGTQGDYTGTLEFYSKEKGEEPVLLIEAGVTIKVSGTSGTLSIVEDHSTCYDFTENDCVNNVPDDTFPSFNVCKDFNFTVPSTKMMNIMVEEVEDDKFLKLSYEGETIALMSLPSKDCESSQPREVVAGLAVVGTNNLPQICKY